MRAGVLVASLVLLPASARAEPKPSSGEHRIAWTYPRFRAAELTLTLGTFLTTTFVEWQAYKRGDFYPDSGWRGGILFDNVAREAFRGRSATVRRDAANASDYLWHFTEEFPIVEGLLIPIAFDRVNTDVALQMTMLTWEVETFSFFLVRLGERGIGRERPSVQGCVDDPDYDGSCAGGTGKNASFPSGHAAMSFAGAALTCSHHAALALYGSDTMGKLACALTMTTATVASALRIVAERHWASDVMIGAGIGLATGFLTPYALHYGPHLRTKQVTIAAVPWANDERAIGMALAGVD